MTSSSSRDALQHERTSLAWERTAITATFVMLPMVVVNARSQSWWMTVLGSAATIVAGLLVFGVHARFAQLRDDEPFSPFEPMVRVAAVASLAALLALGTVLVAYLR